jgi:hypothetical protein
MTPQMMTAEILFLDPADLVPAINELQELGFSVEVLNWFDPCGTACRWIMAGIPTELGDGEFFHWAQGIAAPLGGDVVTTMPVTMTADYLREHAQP